MRGGSSRNEGEVSDPLDVLSGMISNLGQALLGIACVSGLSYLPDTGVVPSTALWLSLGLYVSDSCIVA